MRVQGLVMCNKPFLNVDAGLDLARRMTQADRASVVIMCKI